MNIWENDFSNYGYEPQPEIKTSSEEKGGV